MKSPKDIQERLLSYQDLGYKDFTSKHIPNISKETIIGVRMPNIRLLAKEIVRNKQLCKDFLRDLPHTYYEENILHSCVISILKNPDDIFEYIEEFLPYIDNWGVNDALNPKVLKKKQDTLEKLYGRITEWAFSDEEYVVRFACFALLCNFVDSNFNISHLDLILQISKREVSEKYYTKMGIAWYLSMVLVRHYDKAIFILEEKLLPTWIHNKTIQKTIESYKCRPEWKEYLKSLCVKNSSK